MFLKQCFIFWRIQNCPCLEGDASCNNEVFCYEIWFQFFCHCLLFFCSYGLYIHVKKGGREERTALSYALVSCFCNDLIQVLTMKQLTVITFKVL